METNKKLAEIFDIYKANKNFDSSLDKFVSEIVPIKNEKDPSWEMNAQNLLKAVALSLLQNDKITKDTFTIAEIKRLCELGKIDSVNAFKENNTKQTRLIEYFRNQSQECRELADSVVSNSHNTTMNILCQLYTYLVRVK